MKKITFIITALLIGSLLLTNCKKKSADDNGNVNPPTPDEIRYRITKSNDSYTADPSLKYNIVYYTSNTDSVVLNNVSLPWQSEQITVTQKPFTARLKAELTFNEEDLPDHSFYLGHQHFIYYNTICYHPFNRFLIMPSKEHFLNFVATHPDSELVRFTEEYIVE